MLGLNYFDGILYINLAIRKDRRVEIENELSKFSVHPGKLFRIEADYDELNGVKGCVSSHIRALNFAIEKGWNNVLILEDDCCFVKGPTEIDSYIQEFMRHFKNEWDVFFLGTHKMFARMTDHPDYVQIHFSLRSHAYVVNRPYLVKLRDHFMTTYDAVKDDLFYPFSLTKALDRRWVEMQIADRWFAGKDQMAEQRDSYSDIEKEVKIH
jgi:GR25 family glycosyltransferase involved in LPS biosynthesis